MLGGGPSLLGVFLKDFCIPGGGSTGCFSMRSSRFSAAEAEAQCRGNILVDKNKHNQAMAIMKKIVGDTTQKRMGYNQLMGFLVSMMGGPLSSLHPFFKDFCIPSGGTGCFSLRSSRISATEGDKVASGGGIYTTK
ncbi:hypothetical protein RHGRI_025863 [Rhododendron griersonianum]|uniref:Uncharacterized protein n=1 Tax=Rhododendron griersonianum TaxID=479676 RepID=A0AAV6IRX6_9ERIC|nr:hypothetical protein RHGRI_025863 [Rhododendron griersonianum]